MPGLNFQELIFKLSEFWAEQGCVIALPYDLEVGAGTMCPETFFRVLGRAPWRVAYLQPSRRPADGRYGENPNRLLKHTQMQVVLKPPPADIQDVYLASLEAMGIRLRDHDIRFEEDNWEAPTLGAWGIGWQVMLDGLEITQFTYFQQSGGMDLEPISVELTYGLERIAAFLQNVDDVFEVRWNNSLKYRDLRREEEFELSLYDFEQADADNCRKQFDLCEAEAARLLEGCRRSQESDTRSQGSGVRSQGSGVTSQKKGVIPAKAGIHEEKGIPAYAGMTTAQGQRTTAEGQRTTAEGQRTTDDGLRASDAPLVTRHSSLVTENARFPLRKVYELALKCSHLFNILDARGAISVTERVALIARVRKLTCEVARIYVERLELETEGAPA